MENKDIELVMQQANVTRAKVCIIMLCLSVLVSSHCSQAVKALKNNDNDIVNAIMVSGMVWKIDELFDCFFSLFL